VMHDAPVQRAIDDAQFMATGSDVGHRSGVRQPQQVAALPAAEQEAGLYSSVRAQRRRLDLSAPTRPVACRAGSSGPMICRIRHIRKRSLTTVSGLLRQGKRNVGDRRPFVDAPAKDFLRWHSRVQAAGDALTLCRHDAESITIERGYANGV
jgi:hypothetical protein